MIDTWNDQFTMETSDNDDAERYHTHRQRDDLYYDSGSEDSRDSE